jgi:cytochrome c oxidase assembly protein subunit 15
MLHRFSKFVAACTVLLILAGSLVTSHGAGLSVPDWPTSYGWNMFTFPPSMWVANIWYEHGHRLVASTVGFLTIVLAIWLWIAEPARRWLQRLGVIALAAVIAQGLLGGLTVLYLLPPAVSTAHAGLAEIFFCLTVAIALFTSPDWKKGYANETSPVSGVDDARLRRLATGTSIAIYCQILIGATMRHTGAGLAIPDFPLMFGGVIPDHWNAGIAIHFAHRLGAVVVAAIGDSIGDLHLAVAHRSAGAGVPGIAAADSDPGADCAGRVDRRQPAAAVDQQFSRRLRCTRPDDVADHHAAVVAIPVR